MRSGESQRLGLVSCVKSRRDDLLTLYLKAMSYSEVQFHIPIVILYDDFVAFYCDRSWEWTLELACRSLQFISYCKCPQSQAVRNLTFVSRVAAIRELQILYT